MFDYVCIDFETANGSRNSACALGVVVIKDSEIVNREYYLINPPDCNSNFQNTHINNISYEMVMNEPYFDTIWEKIKKYFNQEIIVAHNISFDIDVLSKTLKYYNIELPKIRCLDTIIIAKKIFPDLENYKLDTICKVLDYKFKHHNALEDAMACAKIIQSALFIPDFNLASYVINMDLSMNKIHDTNSTDNISKRKHNMIKINEIIPSKTEFDSAHPFYKKNIVFTGDLSIERKEAMQKVVDVGGIIKSGISTKTDYLVVGNQNPEFVGKSGHSTKELKANEYIQKGINIKIINEKDFFKLLHNSNMIIGDTYYQFKSLEQKVELLKKYGILPNNADKLKPIYYNGAYTDKIVECDVVGYTFIFKDSITFVIQIKNKFLPIHSACLKDMQPTKKEQFHLSLKRLFDKIKKEYDLQPNDIVLSDNVSVKGEKKGTVISQSICIIEVAYPIGASNKTVSTTVLKIDYDTKIALTIREKQFKNIPTPSGIEVKQEQNAYVVKFSIDSDDLLDYIEQNIRFCIDNHYSSSSFGCCSRFIQCSDSKKCIHDNKLYAKGCIYRRSLEAGIIFYGKNKNI